MPKRAHDPLTPLQQEHKTSADPRPALLYDIDTMQHSAFANHVAPCLKGDTFSAKTVTAVLEKMHSPAAYVRRTT